MHIYQKPQKHAHETLENYKDCTINGRSIGTLFVSQQKNLPSKKYSLKYSEVVS